MSKDKKPNIVIFRNGKAGQPVTRNDGSIVLNAQGEQFNQSDFTGKIELPEGLPAGEYEVAIYESIAKSGLNYMRGSIRPAWKKPEGAEEKKKFDGRSFVKAAQNAHNAAKSNGFQPQAEEEDDSTPF